MADGTPDISRIVKLIMDNPKLIEEIGEMMKNGDSAPKSESDEKPTAPAVEQTAALSAADEPRSKNRRDLLSALKPYLSEKRSRAIDSMISMAEVFAMLKR